MRLTSLIVFPMLFCLMWISSCRKDFEYVRSSGNLTFSKDTVYLDTVFSKIGSSTYTLKVYNATRDDVVIPSISLKKGPESFYRLNVDGVAGKSFVNIPIYAQDSLFILVETTIAIEDPSVKEILYTDAIQFDTEPFEQTIELVTLAKDAIFLYPKPNAGGKTSSVVFEIDENGNEITIAGFEFKDDELTFTNEKPYVIYGFGMVPPGKELRIEAGSRVFFHKDSGLLIQNDAAIVINGKLSKDLKLLEGEVIFQGDRLEPEFTEIPGQWGALWIASGSTANTIEYLTIKNAEIGLVVEGGLDTKVNTLIIKNSQVYNNRRHNLWTKKANILAENLVLGSAGASSFYCEKGGSYSFTHCTIANYWNKGFRTRPALEISNTTISDKNGADLIRADFKNCIIDGNTQTELSLRSNGLNIFNFSFQNCLIKYNSNQPTNEANEFYNFSDSNYYLAVNLNGFPDFFLPTKNDLRIGKDSEIIDLGDLNAALTIPIDLLGAPRTIAPDLGAYEAQEQPE